MSIGTQWLEPDSLLQKFDGFLNLAEIRNNRRKADLRLRRSRVKLRGSSILSLSPFCISIYTNENLTNSGVTFRGVGILSDCALGGDPRFLVGVSDIFARDIAQGPPAFR